MSHATSVAEPISMRKVLDDDEYDDFRTERVEQSMMVVVVLIITIATVV